RIPRASRPFSVSRSSRVSTRLRRACARQAAASVSYAGRGTRCRHSDESAPYASGRTPCCLASSRNSSQFVSASIAALSDVRLPVPRAVRTAATSRASSAAIDRALSAMGEVVLHELIDEPADARVGACGVDVELLLQPGAHVLHAHPLLEVLPDARAGRVQAE